MNEKLVHKKKLEDISHYCEATDCVNKKLLALPTGQLPRRKITSNSF